MSDYLRILVATDITDSGTLVARRGAELAHHYGAGLTLLHVIAHFPQNIPVTPVVPESVDPTTFYKERARRNLEEIANTIGREDAAQQVIVSMESARQEILRFAEEEGSDLIVIGSRSGAAAQVLGSTTMGVVYDAPCDTMVVHVAGQR